MDLSVIKDIAYLVLFAISVYGFYKSQKETASQPLSELRARVEALELKSKEHDRMLANDLIRLKDIENGTRVTQKAILALLEHGLDGNNIDAMQKAKDELQSYLIGR